MTLSVSEGVVCRSVWSSALIVQFDPMQQLNTFSGLAYIDRVSYDQAAHKFLSVKHADPEV
jgi:hypothetical protein